MLWTHLVTDEACVKVKKDVRHKEEIDQQVGHQRPIDLQVRHQCR